MPELNPRILLNVTIKLEIPQTGKFTLLDLPRDKQIAILIARLKTRV